MYGRANDGAGPTDGAVSLSPSQRRLWFYHRLFPEARQASVIGESLAGPIDVVALRTAFGAVIRRHESLRWRFPECLGQPYVEVDPPGEAELPVDELGHDCADVDSAADTAIAAELRAEVQRPFDLARGPLLRVRLLRLHASSHVLVLAVHPMVCDVTSLALVWRDLGVAYSQVRAGVAPLRGSPATGYADYLVWLARRQAERSVVDPGGWGARLAGVPGVVDLPRDYARPPVQTHRAAEVVRSVPEDVVAAVRRSATDLGVAPGVLLLAAFSVLLQRLTGHTDLVVGVATVDRRCPEFECSRWACSPWCTFPT